MGVDIKVPEQTLTPLFPGSTNPQQSAAMKISSMNNQQAAVAKIGGVKRKKGGGNLAVQPTNTSTMNVNGLLAKVAGSYVNSQANREYDNEAFKGGRTRRRTRRRTTRRTKKTRGSRHKKTRR